MTASPRFGVNYVPSTLWWHIWMDWDAERLRRDLEGIAGLGMDHIRAHLLWSVFQPNPNRVSERALDHLTELLEIADACNLDVQVTVLNGWLSGFAFYPAWKNPVPDAPGLNLFTDPGMIEAEEHLFSALAARVAQHPRFLGFDIGNELNVLQWGADRVGLPEADAWQTRLLAHCERLAPGKLHVNGVDHQPWFGARGFSRDALSTTGAASSVHSWIAFTGALERYGAHGTGSVHLAAYMVELAKAFHTDPARRVWVQEFGASRQWMPEAEIPAFAQSTVRHALGCSNLWGFTWWCSHDLDAGLTGFNPLEYDLGLFDSTGRLKPVGSSLKALIASVRRNPPQPLERSVALVLPARTEPDWDFVGAYMRLVDDGVHPAVVLEERSDAVSLEARGIRELVHLP